MKYEIITIGVSLGGLDAVKTIIEKLPVNFPLPIVIVQHRKSTTDNTLQILLSYYGKMKVIEPEDKEEIKPGMIYLAPTDFHLLFEEKHFSLSLDPPVNYARPSIDVLFESAADIYRSKVIGIILTGSSKDGAAGLAAIKLRGGYAIVQDPSTAESDILPKVAIALVPDAEILTLNEIASLLVKLKNV